MSIKFFFEQTYFVWGMLIKVINLSQACNCSIWKAEAHP